MRNPRWIATLPILSLASLLACSPVLGATFCVATGTQLYNNLITAQSNGESDDIRIRSGVMTGSGATGSNPRWNYRAAASDNTAGLSISGGWNSTCTTQSADPGATQLDAENLGTALRISNGSGDLLSANISVRNLTVTRGRPSTSGFGAGIDYFVDATIGTNFIVENVLVTASTARSGATGSTSISVQQQNSGFVRIRNVVVSNNTMGASGSGGMSVTTSGNAIGYVTNNSIFNNSGSGPFSGLALLGVIAASNNVVAGNSSSAAISYQAFANTSTGLTLRNNHFGTQNFTGNNQIESGTSSGDPQWDIVGSVAIPKAISVLRDSGNNNPSGQLPATDYNGNPRIINAVVDRGAIEAALVPSIGPTITAVFPEPNSLTTFAAVDVFENIQFSIQFAATGGTAPGATTLNCTDNHPLVSLFPVNQTIQVGGNVQPVTLTLTQDADGYLATVNCTASTGGINTPFTYQFRVNPGIVASGPLITPLAPLANSTTALTGTTLDQVVTSTLTFTAQSGSPGESSQLQCTPLTGVIAVTGNGTQTVPTGSTPQPVAVAMLVSNQAQTATLRCRVTRNGAAAVDYTYTYTLNAAVQLFKNSFE